MRKVGVAHLTKNKAYLAVGKDFWRRRMPTLIKPKEKKFKD